MMHQFIRRAAVVALASVWLALPAHAQSNQPSAASLAAAKEILEIKGSTHLFDPVAPGVVEQVRLMFLQTNPMVSKDLNDVAARLRDQYAPRSSELRDNLIRTYATRFTEAELKELLAFYKTPLGRKAIQEEPKVLDDSMANMEDWSQKLTTEVIDKMRAEMKKKGHDL